MSLHPAWSSTYTSTCSVTTWQPVTSEHLHLHLHLVTSTHRAKVPSLLLQQQAVRHMWGNKGGCGT